MKKIKIRIIISVITFLLAVAAVTGAAALGRYFWGRAKAAVTAWKEEAPGEQQPLGPDAAGRDQGGTDHTGSTDVSGNGTDPGNVMNPGGGESSGNIPGSGSGMNSGNGDGAVIGQGFADLKGSGKEAVLGGLEESGEAQNAPQTAGNPGQVSLTAGPARVKGIYVTGPMAGSQGFDKLLELADTTELNAMVIDVKNDDGEITFRIDQETARDMGACVSYIPDMEAFMARLKEHGVYTIARIVCFKDPYLAEHQPELALKKPDGKAVTDGNGLAWVNPYREEVWEYLVELAKAAAKAGFDEVQYDYVRFPIGSDADQADYGVDMENYPKKDAITGFLTYAAQELHKVQMPVTADVFGTIIGSSTDVENVGQDYAQLASILDVVSPMVYPSHYGSGVFGLDVPDAHPYETVYAAMQASQKELEEITGKRAAVRPWLQAFTAAWVDGHISYGGEQIRQQIQAVYDAGYEEWILWNAANRYGRDGLLEE